MTVADLTDQFPGDELVMSECMDGGEGPPYTYDMQVYAWVEGELGPFLWYKSDTTFGSADEAFDAFDAHEGDYWLDRYEGQYYDPDQDERWDASRFEDE